MVYTPAKADVEGFRPSPMSATHEVTLLLAAWAKGNQQALDELTPLVYKRAALACRELLAERTPGPHASADGAGP